ncbi:hypothetical protein MBCUT_03580 [Methanobrevibacter cuticularis]|uniref:Glycine transporter domain-containing protein n=1 Tax=Methanobrevibacter cuticularis TaxID=47311 RepID=A0A166EXX0_9EURY|nr:hypothetical protein [Methanobrevibacter cuticularis]KZX17126.1 hypothetical protein MBCUT_03580 [Methanobrevibacter cuticularis]
MFDPVLACFLGIACDALTGFIREIHLNTAGAIIFASSSFLLGFLSLKFFYVFLVAISIAHAMIGCDMKLEDL